MANLTLPPIGYPGTADIAIDLAGELETAEVLTGTQTVVSEDTDVLTIGTVTINAGVLTKKNNSTVAIGKAVQFRVTSALSVTRNIKLTITFAGDSGTTGPYVVTQPVKPTLP